MIGNPNFSKAVEGESYYYAEILPAALAALGEIGAEGRETEGVLDTIGQDPNLAIAKLGREALAEIGR